MTLLRGPIFSSIQHKVYQYQQMRHTKVAIASTISVDTVQFPQSIATYLMMFPDPGRGSIENPNKDPKCKANKSNNESI